MQGLNRVDKANSFNIQPERSWRKCSSPQKEIFSNDISPEENRYEKPPQRARDKGAPPREQTKGLEMSRQELLRLPRQEDPPTWPGRS